MRGPQVSSYLIRTSDRTANHQTVPASEVNSSDTERASEPSQCVALKPPSAWFCVHSLTAHIEATDTPPLLPDHWSNGSVGKAGGRKVCWERKQRWQRQNHHAGEECPPMEGATSTVLPIYLCPINMGQTLVSLGPPLFLLPRQPGRVIQAAGFAGEAWG